MTEKEDKKDEVGFACSACGCRHFYVDGTRTANRQVIRYRVCRNCGKRLTTVEKPLQK